MRDIKFKGQWVGERSGKKEWAYYGIGTKPALLAAHWIVEDLQYIGKDANGKDIYEDDIVLGQIWNWPLARTFRVKYDEDTLSWFPFNEVHPTAEGDEKLEPYMCEVVGAFAENPRTIKAPLLGRALSANAKRQVVEHEVEQW